MREFDPVPILAALDRHSVRFVVIGGIAAIAQGYPLPTEDVDVTPSRDAENLVRLAAALGDLGAELRTDKESVAFPIEAALLRQGESWTLSTKHGDLDLMFVPPGTHGYEDLRRDALETEIAPGVSVRIASLRDVIRSKEASNRLKDQAQLPALRQTLEIIRRRERGD